MSKTDPLSERMKRYESVWRHDLPPHSYYIIRVDGRAFHSYLKGAKRPFDGDFMHNMNHTARYLCENIAGARFAFTQSDEISIVVDCGDENTQPWFGGVQAKIVSIAASLTTCMFNARVNDIDRLAQFDARVFVLPTLQEIVNYLIWRQRDCVRNSIMMVGQTKFSHKQLEGKKTNEVQEMLWDQHRINWNDFTAGEKRGRMVCRAASLTESTFVHKKRLTTHTVSAMRTHWVVSDAIHFTSNVEWLETFMAPIIEDGVSGTAHQSSEVSVL